MPVYTDDRAKEASYWAECDECGWQGQPWDMGEQAEKELQDHLNRATSGGGHNP